MMRAIIIGASSDIGREISKVLSKNNYILGLAARRIDKLIELQKELPGKSYVKYLDVTHNIDAKESLKELISELGGLDLLVIRSGAGYINVNPDLSWERDNENREKGTVEVNICGFMTVVDEALRFFINQGSGHIVGISSVTSLPRNGSAPAYNASKAFVTNYLEGIRDKVKCIGCNITVTDIRPGLAHTNKGSDDEFKWGVPAEKAAIQIYKAIAKKQEYAYITKGWSLYNWVLRILKK